MSEPRRLLETGSDDDLALLRSAKDDAPNRRAQARTLAALGVASSLMAASASTAAATTTGLSIVKWIGIGLAGTALIGGGLVVADHVATSGAGGDASSAYEVPAAAQAPSPITVRGAAQRAPSEGPTIPEEDSAEPEAPFEAEPAMPASPKAAAPKAAAPKAAAPKAAAPSSPASEPTSKKSSLADEVAALDDARAAMAGGNADEALAALNQHDRKFDGGMLGPEAEVLRIEVLIGAGRKAEAAALAQSFLAAHPSSPYAARVRSLLGQANSAR